MNRLLLSSSIILLSVFHANAQFNKTVSASFENTSLIQAIRNIESEHEIKVYFKEEWVSSKFVSGQFNDVALNVILDEILKNQNLTYVLREPNFVILLPDEGSSKNATTIQKPSDSRVAIGSLDLEAEKATLSGYVVNGENNQPLEGAVVTINELDKRQVTTPDGFFAVELPVGNHELKFHHPTMVDYAISIALNSNGKLNVLMFEDVLLLDEVVISTQSIDQNVSKTISGQELIDIKTIKSIPAFFGEADVFNSILSLPGVSKVGEGGSGINVRGGGVGQNLIRIDNATIYNPSHLFGFFSTFNADAVSSVNFYRGSIPAEYGGRLSSVMDVEMKSGNKSKISGAGGVGFINSRLLVEGPIRKDSTSFLASIRAAYPSYIIQNLEDQDLSNSAAFFGDANLKIDHLFDDRNRISLTGYISNDRFDFSDEAEYDYGNKAMSAEWNGQLNDETFIQSSINYSRYNYRFKESSDPILASSLEAGIDQLTFDTKIQKDIESHSLTYGANVILMSINPGEYNKESQESLLEPLSINNENGIVSAVFIGDEWEFNDELSVYGGLRYSFYSGGRDGLEKNYHGPEPRLSMNYKTSQSSSLKLGYNRMRQYVHFISNTTSATPIDLWKLSNSSITPSIADQLTFGYFKNFKQNMYEVSIESFYKKTSNLIEYKNGADLFVNDNIEGELIQGEGKAYGLELLIKKKRGKLDGWISYTFSRSLIKTNGSELDEIINEGNFFPTNFDQPHNLTAFSKIQLSKRFSVNTNFTYNTGRPISYPESIYQIRGVQIADFAERNKYRIPDYHRLDVSFVMTTSLKRKKKVEANWSFSIYNLYGRKNIYSVYFKNNAINGESESFRLSVIARPILAISYNFKF